MLRGSTLALAVLVAAGCFGPDEYVPPPEPPVPLKGFSWVIDGRLAGMPQPGARTSLELDLGFLEEQGVDLLVSLSEAGTDPEAAARHQITVLHLPVRDFTAPSMLQLVTFTDAARIALDEGRSVGVHCGAGKGRTGTFLSAYFVTTGMSANAAIAHVRALRPGSVETAAQERAVHDFASWGQSRPFAPPAGSSE